MTDRSLEQAGRAYLNRLLSERNQYPDRAAQIDEQIRRAFERRVAILVLDMCGFSRLSAEKGIIHYLAMINQMEEAALPSVTGNGGRVIKQEADNLFAVFDHPVNALESALDILRSFSAINTVLPDERDIYGSVGIGYGDTLVIGGQDLFGQEMNLACKLGEDLAQKMEILITASAHDSMPPGRYAFTPARFLTSGIEILCYRYERSLYGKQQQ